jgi:hypothetical protein
MTIRSTLYSLCFLIGCGGKSSPQTSGPATSTTCQPVTCELACPNGFKKDANGCEICACAAACQPVTCDLHCENGFTTNAEGCDICSCK